MRALAIAGVVALGALCCGTAGASANDSVLVSASSSAQLPAGARFVAKLAPGLSTYTVPVPSGASASRYAERLARDGSVYAAQPNRLPVRRASVAGLCATAPDGLLDTVPASVNALSVTPPAATKPIAVLDTGVAPDSPELAGRVLPSFDATRNVAGNDVDADGHGTQVAAVAAGASGLFRGVSPTSPIMPIDIYTPSGDTTAAWLVRAIQNAVQRKAGIINISGSSPAAGLSAQDIAVVEQAIDAAYAQGVITVVSAGNEGKGDPTMPGSAPHVLDVGSIAFSGIRDGFSNFGPYLDLMVPAAQLTLPTTPSLCTGGFASATGTSFASPAVAGAAALIQAARPELTTQQLFDLLRTRAVVAPDTPRTDDTGYGKLDVATGLAAKAPLKEPELDDDVFWLKGFYAKAHPPYLRLARVAKLAGTVSSVKDPQDVFPVYLKKGQVLRVAATAKPSSALIDLGIWNRNTGAFDIGLGRTSALLADPVGLTSTPAVSYRAKRTGTFFVSVEAPDLQTASDPQATPDFTVPTEIAYAVTLRRSR